MKNIFVLEEKMVIKTLLIFLIIVAGISQSQVMAQTGKVRLSLTCKEKVMPDVLKEVEKLSGLKVLFTYNEVQDFKVTVNLKDATVQEAMEAIVQPFPLTFKINEKYITVSKTKKGRSGQRKVISGKVVDQKGFPLPGVNIQTNDKNVMGVTDMNGDFRINIPEGKNITTVNFSFVGMEQQSFPYEGKRLNVTMKDLSNTMDEVVVTGLFNYKAASFTGSAKTYSKDDLQMVGNQNIIKSLSNLDPSFVLEDNYLNGSNPNAFNDITIRGNASFTGLQGEYFESCQRCSCSGNHRTGSR